VALPLDWASPVTVWSSGEAETVAVGEVSGELIAPDAPVLIGDGGHGEGDAAAVATPPTIGVGHGLAGAYLLGAFGLMGWLWLARRKLARQLSNARPARARVAALAPSHRVLEHERLGPLAFGIREPVVVVPIDLADDLDDAALGCVVAHEVAHLRRRDPALALLTSVATCLAWPVLPVWLAAARVRHLIELAADARALAGAPARTYGQTLIRLADRVTPRGPLTAGVYLGSFAALRGRVAALRVRSKLPGAVQLGATVAVAAGVLACAGVEGESVDDPDALAQRCETLKEQATRLHDEREKTKEGKVGAESARAYDAYADECEADPDYAEVLYYRAELMWAEASDAWNAGDKEAARASFARAHAAFQRALAEQPERFTQDAAYGQLLAKWNELETDVDAKPRVEKHERKSGGTKFPVSDYTQEERELLDAYDAYQRHVTDPSNSEHQKVLFHRAKLAMNHNRFDEAETALRALLDGSDGTSRHVWAAEMLTDALTIAWVDETATDEQRAAAERALATWLERVASMQLYALDEAEQLRGAVPALQAGIAWKQGLRAYEAGEGERCLEIFTRLAADHPDHPKLAEIQVNADRCRTLVAG
jgi:hypothetical protein